MSEANLKTGRESNIRPAHLFRAVGQRVEIACHVMGSNNDIKGCPDFQQMTHTKPLLKPMCYPQFALSA